MDATFSIIYYGTRRLLRAKEAPGGDMEYLLRVDEAADFLRVNPGTLRHWVRHGRINARWSGRQYVFSQTDLEEFLTPAKPTRSLNALHHPDKEPVTVK
jgi:excisionase family DNA binding protein